MAALCFLLSVFICWKDWEPIALPDVLRSSFWQGVLRESVLGAGGVTMDTGQSDLCTTREKTISLVEEIREVRVGATCHKNVE